MGRVAGPVRRLTAGPHQLYQSSPACVNPAVDDGHVELRLGGQLARARSPADARARLDLGAPAHQPTDQLLPGRGRQEHEQGLRHRARAPGGRPAGRSPAAPAGPRPAPARPGPAGCRSGPPVHHGPLQQLALGDQPVELVVGDEVVVDAVLTPRAGGGGSSRRPRSRPRGSAPGPRRSASPCQRRWDRQGRSGGRGQARGRRAASLAGELVDERRHLVGARPRTRRLSEISSRSITWRARTLPMPGIDWSSSRTRILPTTSSSLSPRSRRPRCSRRA